MQISEFTIFNYTNERTWIKNFDNNEVQPIHEFKQLAKQYLKDIQVERMKQEEQANKNKKKKSQKLLIN